MILIENMNIEISIVGEVLDNELFVNFLIDQPQQ
jgi:hypothetical protein